MTHHIDVQTDHLARSPSPDMQRLRKPNLAFNLGTLLILAIPTLHLLGIGLYGMGQLIFILGVSFSLAIWGWGIIVLGRDKRLRVLMAFGTRSNREAVAKSLAEYSWLNRQPQKIVLDEFDFYLRGEAFRMAYQIIASLVALVAIAAFFLALSGVKLNWGMVLAFAFPFGIVWLLALPTSVVVWLGDAASDEENEASALPASRKRLA